MCDYCALYLDKSESLGIETLRGAFKKTKQNNQAHQQFIYMFVNTMELEPK